MFKLDSPKKISQLNLSLQKNKRYPDFFFSYNTEIKPEFNFLFSMVPAQRVLPNLLGPASM